MTKALPDATVRGIVLITPIDNQMNILSSIQNDEFESNHQRHKREAYDPYDVYYFYPRSLNRQSGNGAPRYDRYDSERDSYINRRDVDDANQIETKNGQKYKYTPLFQYKSTQSRRRKLFVPNLFG